MDVPTLEKPVIQDARATFQSYCIQLFENDYIFTIIYITVDMLGIWVMCRQVKLHYLGIRFTTDIVPSSSSPHPHQSEGS